jgi:hypothetical protein
MAEMTRKIEWTTGAGKAASITIELQTSKSVFADGDRTEVPCCEIYTAVEHDGQLMGHDIIDLANLPKHPANALGVALCGRLVIKRAQYDQYLQAKAEVEATPEWQAKVAKDAKARAESRAYDQHRKRVEDMMTLNGQTY